MSSLSPRRKVVITSGTESVGQNMLDAVLTIDKYSVIVLSRREYSNLVEKGATVVVVD